MPHDHVERRDGLVGHGWSVSLQRFFQADEADLGDPFDLNFEASIASFARPGQRHFQVDTLATEWKWVFGVQIALAVERRVLRVENVLELLHHRVNDLSIDTLGTLVGLNVKIVVLNEYARNSNGEVIGTQFDRATFAAEVRPRRRREIEGRVQHGHDAAARRRRRHRGQVRRRRKAHGVGCRRAGRARARVDHVVAVDVVGGVQGGRDRRLANRWKKHGLEGFTGTPFENRVVLMNAAAKEVCQ